MNLFERTNAADFCTLARALALGRGNPEASAFYAKEYNASDLVMRLVEKAAIAAGTADGSSWGAQLTEYLVSVAGFLASLENMSLFDALAPNMKRVPPRMQATVVTAGATSTTVAEGAWLPLSRMSFSGTDLDPIKIASMIVLTEELLRFESSGAAALWSQEMRAAVSRQTDKTIVPLLLAGVALAASTGDPDEDLLNAFAAVNLDQFSRPVIAMSPQIVRRLCFLSTGSGRRFPDLALSGGSISGAVVIPCDVLHNYLSDGEVVIVADSAQLGGEGTVAALRMSTQADIAMLDAASGSEAVTSMWQTNSAAVIVDRWISFARLRSTAVAAIKNCNYDNGSPA